MRRKIVAGNWKMNGSISFVRDYLAQFIPAIQDVASDVQIIIAPPVALMSELQAGLEGVDISLASQNVAAYSSGAYTGETSAGMLSDLGSKWSLVGHSERRALFGETNESVVEKVGQLIKNGLHPILCVGETLSEREQGGAEQVVAEQLGAVLDAYDVEVLAGLVIAYEPVWAIGTGCTATPEQAQEMHAFIRRRVAEKSEALASELVILYGGSVNASNARALFAKEDIDGGLVGGASLKADEFSQICECIG